MDVGIEAVLGRIRAYAVFRGWKKSRLAAAAGLRDTTLRDFESPNWNPRIKTVRKLEAIIPPDFDAGPTREREDVAA